MRTCNNEHMQLLVDALESDEYEQTTSVLRRDTAFCCLGVACDISGLGQWQQVNDSEFAYRCGDDFSMSVLPTDVQDWLGLVEQSEYDSPEELIVDSQYRDNQNQVLESAMVMNDSNCTFAEIATALRETYLED